MDGTEKEKNEHSFKDRLTRIRIKSVHKLFAVYEKLPSWKTIHHGGAMPSHEIMGSGEDGKAIRPKMIFPMNDSIWNSCMIPICEPWCWYIYLQNWVILFGQMLVNIPYMEHMGYDMIWTFWQFQLLKSQLLLESIPNSCQFRSGFVQKLVKPSKMPVFRGKVIS